MLKTRAELVKASRSGKTDPLVVKIDDELTITAGPRRRSLVLPRRLAPLCIASARLEGSSLVVRFAPDAGAEAEAS